MSEEREQILGAAVDEFAEVGFGKASLDSIARRIPLNVGSLRALFVDKETLLAEVLKEATGPAIGAFALAVEEIEDPREMLRKSLHLYDQWFLANEKIAKIFARCLLEGTDALRVLYQQAFLPSEYYERLEQMVEKGQVRCKDVFMLDVLIDSMIVFPHITREALKMMEPAQDFEKTIERRFEAMMDLFENGLFSRD